jgi:hypothetical protein
MYSKKLHLDINSHLFCTSSYYLFSVEIQKPIYCFLFLFKAFHFFFNLWVLEFEFRAGALLLESQLHPYLDINKTKCLPSRTLYLSWGKRSVTIWYLVSQPYLHTCIPSTQEAEAGGSILKKVLS